MFVNLSVNSKQRTMDKQTRTNYKEPKFYLDKRGNKPAAIFLKYSFAAGQRLSYFTGETIEPDKWNETTQRVKRNVNNGSGLNESLDKLFETAKQIVRDHRLQNKPLNVQEFKRLLNMTRNKVTTKENFFFVFDEFTRSESMAKAWSVNMATNYQSLKSYLLKFQAFRNREISFHKINNDFNIELLEYCRTKSLKNSTITHYYNLLKIFLSWSADKSYCTLETKKALAIDLKTAKNKVVSLSFQEIKAIDSLEVSGSLEAAKDCLVLQSFLWV
jgi:hypothetical protein